MARRKDRYGLWIVAVAATFICFVVLILSSTVYGAENTVGVEVCAPAVAPVLTSPDQNFETKKSTAIIRGTAASEATVYVYRNAEQIAFTKVNSAGDYAVSAALLVGTNVLRVATKNTCQEPAYANRTITIVRKQNTPSTPNKEQGNPAFIDQSSGYETDETHNQSQQESPQSDDIKNALPIIVKPKNGELVKSASLEVVGTAIPKQKVLVFVNGGLSAEITSDDTGYFSCLVTLVPGSNNITVAVDTNGFLKKSSVDVTYLPGVLTLGRSGQPNKLTPLTLIAAAGTTVASCSLLWLGRNRLRKVYLKHNHLP